jgi:hypothetical protein
VDFMIDWTKTNPQLLVCYDTKYGSFAREPD